jgi:hypothetical protein
MSKRIDFLKSGGICLALPFLESFAEKPEQSTTNNSSAKRFLAIGSNLGWYRKAFYPEQTGKNYSAPSLIQVIEQHRQDFTIFSGLDHRAGNGHGNWDNFLCGQSKGSHSLDQIIADEVGHLTKIPSLQLCSGGIPSIQKMSYTKRGIPLPMNERPSVLYKKMFTTKNDLARTEYLIQSGKSALDTVLNEAKSLSKSISKNDQHKLSEYFTSLREVEKRMHRQQKFLKHGPTKKVNYRLPGYDPIAPSLMLESQRIMYDLIALAFETDTTRVVTLFLAGLGQVFTIDGATLQAGYHALSHHGNDPEMVRDLIKVEMEHLKCFNRFLSQLKNKTDAQGQSLLDSTLVLLGTGMGDASVHANYDLPTLVAGGGFKHGSHISTNRASNNSHLLGDLYLTLLSQMGIHRDNFSNASRPMEIV